jgi:hypothetical protein
MVSRNRGRSCRRELQMATHSKTRRAVQRLRRLARRRREAALRKARQGGTESLPSPARNVDAVSGGIPASRPGPTAETG